MRFSPAWPAFEAQRTIGCAVLDRLVHTAFRIALSGETLRDPKRSTAKRGNADSGTTE